MTKGRPAAILLRFVIPLIIGNIFQQLYNMVDTIIVGRFVGQGALAAVGSTGTVMFLITGLAMGLTTGFAVLTAQMYGAKKEKRLRGSVANAILLAVVFAVILTAASVSIMHPLLKLMNTPTDIYKDAYTYITIISWGLVSTVFYNLASALLRAVGNSRVPLYFLILSAGLNVVLDLVLIVGAHLGVAGAALATVISQGISAILCFVYIMKKVTILKPRKGEWRLDIGMTLYQLKVGAPMALQFAITASGTMIMQSAVNMFGSTSIAGFTAASKLGNLLTQGMPAMGQAMATYGGQNFGDRQIDRISKGVRAAILLETGYSLIAAALGVILLRPALGLFFDASADFAALLPSARTYAYLSYMFYIPLSFIFIFRNTMQACGYGILPMLGGVTELAARCVTAAIAMRMESYLVACAGDPAAWLAAAVFTAAAYLWVIRDIRRRYASGTA